MDKSRVKYPRIKEADSFFRPEFNKYLTALYDAFVPEIRRLRSKREEVLRNALEHGILPGTEHLRINAGEWKVPPVPEELLKPGIEISGPACITGMFINALNPGLEGTRAEGDLDDDEDSAGYRFSDTVMAAYNRLAAVQRTLNYFDQAKNKTYSIADGPLPFFMHRERGLAVDEPEVTIDGSAVPACILGTALTLFYTGRAQAERGQGIYFYLPKLESPEEAVFWKNFFDFSRDHLSFLKNATIRAIILIESLPAVFQMEEMLYALGQYAAGLNAARWDLKASILEFIMADKKMVWPDRFGVDIKQTGFLADIFKRLVAVCHKHGAVPIGGMATALPSKNEEVNRAAAESIRADKVWEAKQGFLRGWVAHIFHMKTAADPFKELQAAGLNSPSGMVDPNDYPVRIEVPEGDITIEGTRRNARMLLEYLEGWLNGRGAKGIDSLAGRPGIHPALMEDLATARISTAQIAQRIIHSAKDSYTGQGHDFTLVDRLLREECEDILLKMKVSPENSSVLSKSPEEALVNYKRAINIALHWIRNYTEFNFRSLGSYTRTQLIKIADKM